LQKRAKWCLSSTHHLRNKITKTTQIMELKTRNGQLGVDA